MTRRLVVKLLARLDASPLPMTDPVRLALEWELLQLQEQIELARMMAAVAPFVSVARPSFSGGLLGASRRRVT